MIASKFGIGQQVRHSLLGYLGVVVDIDPVYSLSEPSPDELAVNDELRAAPWYHGSDGERITAYRFIPTWLKPSYVANCRMNILNSHPLDAAGADHPQTTPGPASA